MSTTSHAASTKHGDDARAEAPRVYLHYTQEELDRAYTQAEWAPNLNEINSRQAQASARVRAELKPRTFQYGPSEDETLDVFGTQATTAPVHIHVHGGAWRALTKEDVSFPAPVFNDAGAIYIALNFSLIPKVRLPDMIAQAQCAVRWIHEHAAEFGGDASRLHISGHSAGAHMASVLLTTDWKARFGLPSDVLKSGLLMSGSYDLEPVLLSIRGSYVKLTREEQVMLSAIRHPDRIEVPIVIAVGDRESPEFQRQATRYFEILRAKAKPVQFIQIGNCNHFEMMDVFADPNSELTRFAIDLINQAVQRPTTSPRP